MPFGRITSVNDRGFAFIKSDQPPFESTFVHVSDLRKAGITNPLVGLALAYSVTSDPVTAKTKAVDVEWLQSAET